MTNPLDSFNLDNFIRASQYFATIKLEADIYREMSIVLKKFFGIELNFFCRKNSSGNIECLFTSDKKSYNDKNLFAKLEPFINDIYNFTFLRVEQLEYYGEKTFILLPVTVFNKLDSILVTAYEGKNEISKDALNILLAVSTIVGTFLERQETHNRLEKLSEQNKMILETTGEGIFGLDTSGCHTFVNPAAAKMLGYEVEELIGQKSHEMWHHHYKNGDVYPATMCPIYQSYKDGTIHYGDNEIFFKKDGSSFPAEFISTPIIKNDQVSGAVVIFKDISQRKKAEKLLKNRQVKIEKLLDKEHQLRGLLKTIAGVNELLITSESIEKLLNESCKRLSKYKKYHLVMIFLKDTNQLYFYTANESIYNKIDKISEDLKKSFLKNSYISDTIKNNRHNQIHNLESLESKEFETILKELGINNIHLLPLRRDAKANSFGILMVNSTNEVVFEFAKEEAQMLQELSGDIGFAIESYRQKDTLIALNNSIKSLIDATMEGLLVFEKGKCTDVNNEAVNLFGYKDKKSFLGSAIFNFVDPRYHERLKEKSALKCLTPFEINLIRKDGSSFIALVRTIDININNVVKTIFTVVDLSELKDKDKMIFQQSKLAAMGEMIGNIAHQWRQPLSIITTCASGLEIKADLETINKDTIKEFAGNVIKQANYLSKTIDDFKDFIKGDTKYLFISVKEALEDTLTLVNATLKNNNINLILNIEDDIDIIGNKNELSQAFINIINNSKDIMKEKIKSDDDRLLFISTRKSGDKTLELKILDSGGGIPFDVKDRIFEPYFTTKHQSVGTGIGLTMVDQIIRKRHQADIDVDNEKFEYNGKKYLGACFTITFTSKDN